MITEVGTPRFGALLNSQVILFSKIWKKSNAAADFNDLEFNKWEKEWEKKHQKNKMKGIEED